MLKPQAKACVVSLMRTPNRILNFDHLRFVRFALLKFGFHSPARNFYVVNSSLNSASSLPEPFHNFSETVSIRFENKKSKTTSKRASKRLETPTVNAPTGMWSLFASRI
jgi:hypothetical protein